VPSESTETAVEAWLRSLHVLTDTAEAAREWRERRYRFARKLGDALVAETEDQAAIAGPVLYGVWLKWGLLYVGQTLEAERRLRDLAVGESHHLANTFPPEIWDRVVLVRWPELQGAAEASESLGARVVGLALEHRMQMAENPLANANRRTSTGGWRSVDRARSASIGARAAPEVEPLFRELKRLWDCAATDAIQAQEDHAFVRCVRPASSLVDPA